jgi:chaperonin GroES
MMKPVNDRVVIKPAKAEEKTKGGIIIPDTAKEKPQKGKVVAVGPGKDGNKPTVKKGDVVLYGKYAGQELQYEGKDYLIMKEDDILVIID